MRVYHWVAILFVGALLTASAASVMLGSQKSDEPDAVRVAAVKNGSSPALIRESQVRRAPSSAPKSSAPQRVETIKFDSWIVTCRDTVGGTAKRTCGASLKAMSQDRRELLLNWELGLNKDGHFITAIYVPPFLAIKKGDAIGWRSPPHSEWCGTQIRQRTGKTYQLPMVWSETMPRRGLDR